MGLREQPAQQPVRRVTRDPWEVATEYLAFARSPAARDARRLRIARDYREFDAIAKTVIPQDEPVALLLGGLDSAALTRYLPEGSVCITVSFPEGRAEDDEVAFARAVTPASCRHEVVIADRVSLDAVLEPLARAKACPSTPAEPGMYLGCVRASELGYRTVVSGLMADAHYGDVARMHALSGDFGAFLRQYLGHAHLDPRVWLRNPAPFMHHFDAYRRARGRVDVLSFVREFAWSDPDALENAAALAGVRHVSPYAVSAAERPHRSKPIPREAFTRAHPLVPHPRKLGFKHPIERWLADYRLPRDIVPDNAPVPRREQKYTLYLLERWWRACSDS